MKFNCGPTPDPHLDEKLAKWRKTTTIWRNKHWKKWQWNKWFAWFPVEVSHNDCRWLEVVERRGMPWGGNDGVVKCFDWEYKSAN